MEIEEKCILISRKEHQKLLEPNNKLNNEIYKLKNENSSLKTKIKTLENKPPKIERVVNPMKLELTLFSEKPIKGCSFFSYLDYTYSRRSEPLIQGVNIDLTKSLRKQISNIKKLITEKVLQNNKINLKVVSQDSKYEARKELIEELNGMNIFRVIKFLKENK